MSDFAGQVQSFALSGTPMPDFSAYGRAPISTEVQPHEVSFRRLKGAHEIARILHLREQLQLPAAALADSGFAVREKKETKLA